MTEKKIKGKTLRTQAVPYTTVPLDLLKADIAYIKSTGEEVKITDTILRVYLYMRNMYCVTLDDPKSFGYFEGWEGIAAAVGKNKDIFTKGNNRPDKILEKLGLLEQKRKSKGRASLKVVKDIVEITDDVVFLNSKADNYKDFKKKEREEYLKNKEEIIEKEMEQTYPADTIEDPFSDPYDDFDEVPF